MYTRNVDHRLLRIYLNKKIKKVKISKQNSNVKVIRKKNMTSTTMIEYKNKIRRVKFTIFFMLLLTKPASTFISVCVYSAFIYIIRNYII